MARAGDASAKPLEEYARKRDFGVTPEPAGAVHEPGAGGLTFVVHKHAARTLHYDLRLEMGGVLASWAVPKGPSFDTKDKHLAVHVEDHPIEYGAFEGVIPAGEYGGGTVMIWDRGAFEPIGDPLKGVADGQLKFVLNGAKLVGQWVLVRMKPRPGDKRENWLLIKERDEHVRPRADYDVTQAEPYSAASGRTMDEIAVSGDVYQGPPAADAAGDPPKVGTAAAAGQEPGAEGPAKRDPFPADAPFQLATLVDEAPSGPDWLHEVKYDGYRLRVELRDGHARVRTRNGEDWTPRFPDIAKAAEALPAKTALIDGEAVVLDAEGRSDFGLLQEALSSKAAARPGAAGPEAARPSLMAFDLLYLDGEDLRGEPLTHRKERLDGLLARAGMASAIRYAEHFSGEGPAFHAASCELLLEGSVSKRADRPWVPGRSRDWLKAKCLARQEFVIGGWTEPAGSRPAFGALLLGVHDGTGALRYAGRVGTGFTERILADVRARLDALAAEEPPFADPPTGKGLHWARPELVAEVWFREWTRDGVVRQPSFEGLRGDKDPADVVRETPDAGGPNGEPPADPPPATGGAATSRNPAATVAGVRISNPEKVLGPAGISKIALARYYEDVADWILPHVSGRLISAVRCPHGPGGGAEQCFYQKHPETRGWPRSLHPVPVRDREGVVDYFFLDDLEGLLSLVQLGVLEIHVWNSLADDFERPDRVIFDLDPGEGVSFGEVIAGAKDIRDALAALGLGAFAKTTGGHGLHVVAPIEVERDFDEVRAWAHAFVETIAAAAPDRFTPRMAKASRPGRVFVDYLRNAHGATAVCALSTRARPGAPVSVPVRWDELASGFDPARYDTASVPARLRALKRDPWEGYEKSRARLTPEMFAAVGLEPPR